MVSVVMGVYAPRDRETLMNAVRSICASSWQNWELVLVDDGTRGEGKTWIAQAAALDARIHLIVHAHNQGLAAALNTAIAHSQGEWIARMDGDDLSHPDRFAQMVAYLQAHPQADWVGCGCMLMDDAGVWGKWMPAAIPQKEDYLAHSPFAHPTVMFRGDMLRREGGYALRKGQYRCEDYELFLRLYAKGYRGHNLQACLYCYREDGYSYRRRTWAAAAAEMAVRREGFARIHAHGVWSKLSMIKPLAVALVPDGIHAAIKYRRYCTNRYHRYWRGTRELLPFSVGESVYEQCCTQVMAPALCAYVAWVLGQAKEKGHKRLYFCARDGWLLLQCAKILCERWHIDIECRYLYVSRYALRLPCYHLDEARACAWICRSALHVTLAVLLERSGIAKVKWPAIVAALRLPFPLDCLLNDRQLETARRAMQGCPLFLRELREVSLAHYQQARAYLRQEGLMAQERFAIVDSGWNGSMALCLSLLLSEGRQRALVEGYYFGLYACDAHLAACSYPYLFSPHTHSFVKSGFCAALFETFCLAPHGMCRGYRRRQGRMEAILQEPKEGSRSLCEQMQRSVQAQAKQLGEQALGAIDHDDLARRVRHALLAWMAFPHKTEAQTIGKLPFCDDIVSGQVQPLAMVFTPTQWRHQFLTGRIRRRFSAHAQRQSAWVAGSAALCAHGARWYQLRHLLGEYLLGWVRAWRM